MPKQANPVALGTTINGTCEGPASTISSSRPRKASASSSTAGPSGSIPAWTARWCCTTATGRELERNHNTNRRDPLIDFSVPADGDYLVSLHDHMYGYFALPGECFYRLTISTPALSRLRLSARRQARDRSEQYTVYGRNLPGGKPAPGVTFGGKQLDMLSVTIPLPGEHARDLVRDGGLYVEPSESFMDGIAYRLKSAADVSNPLLLINGRRSNCDCEAHRAVRPPRHQSCSPRANTSASSIRAAGETGCRFRPRKGDVWWIEVISQRLGLPTDPRMLIQQVKRDAKRRRTGDGHCHASMTTLPTPIACTGRFSTRVLYNMETHDPVYRFVAPEDGSYRVMVQDLARPAQDVLHAAAGRSAPGLSLAIRRPAPGFSPGRRAAPAHEFARRARGPDDHLVSRVAPRRRRADRGFC